MGDFEKKFPASACWKKKIASSTNDIEKKFLHCYKQEKKMLQSYFIGALQNPSKTATIQWLIFDETPFLHQDLFKVFFALDGMSSQKAQFCLWSVRFVFWVADCIPAKETSVNVLSIRFFG